MSLGLGGLYGVLMSWDYAYVLILFVVIYAGLMIRHYWSQSRGSAVPKESPCSDERRRQGRRLSAPRQRPSLDDWIMDQTSLEDWIMGQTTKPRANLCDLLDRYIAQYDVTVRATLDEPRMVSDARTKLQLVQSSVFCDTERYPNPNLEAYKMGLETIIMGYDEADEEIRELLREREKK